MEISELLRRGDFSKSKLFQSQLQASQNSQIDLDTLDRSAVGTAAQKQRSRNYEIHPVRQTMTATTAHTRLGDIPSSLPSSIATIGEFDMKLYSTGKSSVSGSSSLKRKHVRGGSSNQLYSSPLSGDIHLPKRTIQSSLSIQKPKRIRDDHEDLSKTKSFGFMQDQTQHKQLKHNGMHSEYEHAAFSKHKQTNSCDYQMLTPNTAPASTVSSMSKLYGIIESQQGFSPFGKKVGDNNNNKKRLISSIFETDQHLLPDSRKTSSAALSFLGNGRKSEASLTRKTDGINSSISKTNNYLKSGATASYDKRNKQFRNSLNNIHQFSNTLYNDSKTTKGFMHDSIFQNSRHLSPDSLEVPIQPSQTRIKTNQSGTDMKDSSQPKYQEDRVERQRGAEESSGEHAPVLRGKLSKLMGVVRAKRKLTGVLKIGQDVSKGKQKEKVFEDDGQVIHFNKHDALVAALKSEEVGSEMHDIYGAFPDKLKHIQSQVYEALDEYSLASGVIEELGEQKKQYRVIDAVESSLSSITLALEHLERVPSMLQQRDELDKILASMAMSLVKSTAANLTIQIETVMIYAQFNKIISNFGKALRLFKQCKYMAVTALTLKYRMKSYAAIGMCFQSLKLYSLAMVYFGKYLEHAWYLGDKEAELSAYDLIGVTSYLIGDLETAKFYHEKMLMNDNEPEESPARTLGAKKIADKLKKMNSEEYSVKLSVNYKKFFAKIHQSDYEEDYTCSSSDDDEFKITIQKTVSQQANKEYQQYLVELGPKQQKKAELDSKRFIAIYNAEDRVIQQDIRKQANQNIRIEEAKRIAFAVLPNSLKSSLSASAFKPMATAYKPPFRINQFTINRNLDNYLCQDARILKNQPFDFFKLVEDTNDRKVKEKIIGILTKFESNLIFALSMIHCMRERQKFSLQRRRFAFSGVTGAAVMVSEEQAADKNLLQMKIEMSNSKIADDRKAKKKLELIENKSKPNSNKEQFLVLKRYQMHHDVSQSYFHK